MKKIKTIGLDKMGKHIKKYRKYDIFAQKIPINLDKLESVPSCEGLFLTFIFYILMIFYFFMGSPGDIIWGLSPVISQTYMNQKNANEVEFGKHFYFYFNLFDVNDTVFNDDTYLYKMIRLRTIDNRNTSRIDHYFDINECNNSNLNQTISDFKIDEKDRQKYFCPKFEKSENGTNTKIIISGSPNEDYTRFLQVLVYPCYHNNTDNKRNCKNDTEIEDLIADKKLKLKILYPMPIINLLNFSNPISSVMKEDYFYLPSDITNYRFVNYIFDKITIITESNWFTSDSNDTGTFEMKVISQDTRKITLDDPRFFSLDIKSSNFITTHKRTYMKLLDCLSNIGGFYPILFMIFQVFHSFFSQISTLEYIIQKIFNVNNPLKYQKKNKIEIDFSKYDNQTQKRKIPNGSFWWKRINKSRFDLSDMLSGISDLEMKNLNNENIIKENLDLNFNDPNKKIIDLRQSKVNFDLSENRQILDNINDNSMCIAC